MVPLILAWVSLPFGEPSATRCLNDKQVAFTIDGGPSANTQQLLGRLRAQNITVLFEIDSERLSWEGTSSIMQAMDHDGHLLGISLNKGMDINGMSSEGFRGAVQKRAQDFNTAFGKLPLFIRVPQDTTADKISQLQSAGYLVTTPGLNLAGVSTGNCETTFNSTVAKSVYSISGAIALTDTENGCSVNESMKIMSYTKTNGFQIVRMDKCINLEAPYRSKTQDEPVNFSFIDFSQPTTSSTASLGAQSKNTASSNNSKVPDIVLFGLVSALILLL